MTSQISTLPNEAQAEALRLRVWERLTAPSPEIKDNNEKRLARLTSVLLLIVIATTLAGVLANAPILPVPFIAVGLYLLSRTRFYQFASALMLIAVAVPSYLQLISLPADDPLAFVAGLWLLLPIVLSHLVFSFWGSFILSIAFIIPVIVMRFTVLADADEILYVSLVAQLCTLTGILITSSAVRQYYLVQRQLDELRTVQYDLQRTNNDLQIVNKEVRDFANIVAHDLRAPLVNFEGFLDDFKESIDTLTIELIETDNKTVHNLLLNDIPLAYGFILASLEKMRGLVNGILDLARVGRRELHIQTIQTQQVVQNAVNALQHIIIEENIEVQIDTLPTVEADEAAISQIFGNFLDNAIKYRHPERAGKIHIYSEASDDAITFHIKDNGMGIAESQYEKVFQPFRRLVTDGVGDGMGLAYVQTLIRLHGGRVWFTSLKGQGTTFSFSIPQIRS